MRFKGVLLDLDNTLYDYETAHQAGLSAAAQWATDHLQIPSGEFLQCYKKARHSIHVALAGTAASHNRLLYFQKLLEDTGRNPFRAAFDLYRLYWDVSMANMRLFDGVDQLFRICQGRKICVVTDLTADVQHQKIRQLHLEDNIHAMVTSEEIGKEKPAPEIFQAALAKIGCSPDDVCMIGDDYDRDICGAKDVGIASFWLNRDREKRDTAGVREFFSFKEMAEGLAHDGS